MSTPKTSPSGQATCDELNEAKPPENRNTADNSTPPVTPSSSANVELPLVIQNANSPTHPQTRSGILTFLKAILQIPPVVMLLSVFLFSVMVLCVKMASPYYSSFEIISFRGFIGAACLLIYQQIAHGHGLSAMKTPVFGMQMWRAFIGTMSMACWFYGIAHLSLSTSTTLSYMSSIWMAIFIIASAMITHQSKPDVKLLASVTLGFVGIWVILRPSGGSFDLWPSMVVLLSSVFSALAYLQVAALGRIGEPASRTVFYFCVFGTVFGLLMTVFSPKGFSPFSLIGIGWMLLVGIAAMVAQLLLTRAYTYGNPLVNASLQYLGLVFMIIFDWVLGAGWPDSLTWLGMGFVVCSGLFATLLRSRHIPQINKHANKHNP